MICPTNTPSPLSIFFTCFSTLKMHCSESRCTSVLPKHDITSKWLPQKYSSNLSILPLKKSIPGAARLNARPIISEHESNAAISPNCCVRFAANEPVAQAISQYVRLRVP